jgi:hypothetical protein
MPRIEEAMKKVATKNKLSIKWAGEPGSSRLVIKSLEMVGDRLRGTRRPKHISDENREDLNEEIIKEVEGITGTKVGRLRDYFIPK